MLKEQQRSVRFLHRWRGREPGDVNSELEYGVMDALVNRKVCEWHTPQREQPRGRRAVHTDARGGPHG